MRDPMKINAIASAGGITVAVSSDLRRKGRRGTAMTHRRTGERIAVVSNHLPPAGPKFLEAVIHEVMHLQRPRASEKDVEFHARQMAALLRRIGFRLAPTKGPHAD